MNSGPKRPRTLQEVIEQQAPPDLGSDPSAVPAEDDPDPYDGLHLLAKILRVIAYGSSLLAILALVGTFTSAGDRGQSSEAWGSLKFLFPLAIGTITSAAILGWLADSGRDIRRIRLALESREPAKPSAPKGANR